MTDAFVTSLRLGLEGALAVLLLRALAPAGPRRSALLAAAVAAGLAVGATLEPLARARGLAIGDLAPDLHRARGLVALGLLALVLLLRGRLDLAAAGPRARSAAETLALALGLSVILPEGAFWAGRLRDDALLAGATAPVLAAGAAGLAAAALAGLLLAAAARRLRAPPLAPAAALALLFALELAGVAAGGLEANQLPAALTGVVARGVHDAAHLVFVVLQVPDHAYLEDQAYQLILVLLEPALHAGLAAAVIAAPAFSAGRAFLARPAPALGPEVRAPARRAARAAHARASLAGAVPYAVAVAVVCAVTWHARPDAEALYDPLPEPVVDDGAGTVLVPLASPLGGGPERMRKWVYAAGERSVVFFTVRRPDGAIAAALDLCEICQPKGYAQMGADHVFCKYCATPIPMATVGQPGGCNPIPVPSLVKGALLLVPREPLLAAWERGKANVK